MKNKKLINNTISLVVSFILAGLIAFIVFGLSKLIYNPFKALPYWLTVVIPLICLTIIGAIVAGLLTCSGFGVCYGNNNRKDC